MYGKNLSWRRCRPAALLAGALLLPGTAMAIAPGSVAIYSDGSVEKLLERKAGQEVWEDERLRRITRSTNPLLPELGRENLLKGADYSHKLKKGNPAVLLKGKQGDAMEFSIWRTTRFDTGSERLYQCAHLGKHTVKVMGRKEKVQRYRCERYTMGALTWQKKIKETSVIDYSPRMKMVVEQTHTTPKRTKQVTLVKVLAPGKYSYAQVRSELDRMKKAAGKK